ncbi:MAG: cysteine desulfurase [Lachnospiraceae bacterium]|nr:cysteine desulfurase [Lachnospiraceae bacterium]
MNEKKEIYLDNSATTKVFPEVAQLVMKIMTEDYGNPSSMHMAGVNAEGYVKEATEKIAKTLHIKGSSGDLAKRIIFTSGGTESDNLAIIGAAESMKRKGMHIITTRLEHPAVLNSMKELEERGFTVTYLGCDERGRIRLADLEAAITPETILVSIMHTNNEIGSLQPIAEAGELIKRIGPDTLFHVDAVQGYGKADINPVKMHIDMLSVSGHKLHGPKGIGFLYVADGVRLKPVSYGGGQQGGLRSGTLNVPGIAGMALASEMLYSMLKEDTERMYALREHFIKGLSEIGDVRVNGPISNTDENGTYIAAPHIVSTSFKGVRSEVLLHTLEDAGIYISAGSACSSHKRSMSSTMKAIGMSEDLAGSTVRFSFSTDTTEEDIDTCIAVLSDNIPKLRKFVRM